MASKVVVVGAGPGGYGAAIRAAQLGAEVALIEEDHIGGTCLNWGCIPSKVMKTTAELLDKMKKPREFGVAVNGTVGPDMKGLLEKKRVVVQHQIKGLFGILEQHRIQILNGFATIQEMHCCRVALQDGTTIDVPWEKLILAPGSSPMEMASLPFDGQRVLSSNHTLDLEVVPKSLLIVGGGVIGCEFAFIFSCLGANVTVVEAMPRLLPLQSVDGDCSKVVEREMKKRKIQVLLNRTVAGAEAKGGTCQVTLAPSPHLREPGEADKKPGCVEAEKILICIGRRSKTAQMGLERIGVNTDEKGWIIVDRGMRTSAAQVYAIGDALGPQRPMLAYVASREGLVAAENAQGGDSQMKYDVVPGVIFTMPEVACVGLTEIQARDKGFRVRSETVLFRSLGKPHVIGEIAGEAKVVCDGDTGRILGVHLVGPRASDLIAEGTLALQVGCTIKDLADTIHAHPTLAEIMMEVAFKTMDRPIHG